MQNAIPQFNLLKMQFKSFEWIEGEKPLLGGKLDFKNGYKAEGRDTQNFM